MGDGWIAFIFFFLGIGADEAYKFIKIWYKYADQRKARQERLKQQKETRHLRPSQPETGNKHTVIKK